MSKVDEIREWEDQAKAQGLIDVKFYPGSHRENDFASAAEAALALLGGTSLEEDITDVEL